MSEAKCCYRFVCPNGSQRDQPAKRHEGIVQKALASYSFSKAYRWLDVEELLDLKSWDVDHSLSHVLVFTS